MSQHHRLGACSPARHLSQELLHRIFCFLPFPADIIIEQMRISVYSEAKQAFVVSNLRRFSVAVNIVDHQGSICRNWPLTLDASLVYEDGKEVILAQSEPHFRSGSEAGVKDGRATFDLLLGFNALSSQHGGRNFRIRIASRTNPPLTVLSRPVYTTTKLRHRRGPV